MSLQFNTSDPMLGNFTIERPTSNLAAPAPAPKQRPFERFSSDLFGFTGGLLETAGGALDLFGGSPQQQPRRGRGMAPQSAGIDTTTALLIGGGLLALVLVMKGRK